MRFGRDMTRQNTCCTPNVLRVAARVAMIAFFSWHVSQFDAATAESKPQDGKGKPQNGEGKQRDDQDKPWGKSVAVVDATTLNGKVICGYQGWFNCPGDGMELGWKHWAKNARETLGPGNVTVDLWPDVSELPEKVQYPSAFHHADGRVAKAFSSASPEVVAMHFRWMREYGIDGVFLQRFANGLDGGRLQKHKDQVLNLVRRESVRNGRVFAVMYDLSGLRAGQVENVLLDWKTLRSKSEVPLDSTYLHHEGKPLVAVWGVGFNDGRKYSLDECIALVDALKAEGCAVMLGVPSWWREGKRDATDDPRLPKLVQKADIVSPWSVGRYRTPQQALGHADQVWKEDQRWCEKHQVSFLPVAFPGFSWHQLKGAELDMIPRRNGDFLWSQIYGAKQAGCQMLYVAMFDEVDEGTAIFKCDPDPPVSSSEKFLSLGADPNDHYLRIVGEATRGFRGTSVIERELPNLAGR